MKSLCLALAVAALLPSCTLLFDEGTPGNEFPDGQGPLLRYTFSEVGQTTVSSSGSLDLDLRVTGKARVRDGALDLRNATAAEAGVAISIGDAGGVIDACQSSQSLTVSVWLSPGSTAGVEDLPSRIFTIETDSADGGSASTDFTVAQGGLAGAEDYGKFAVRLGDPNATVETQLVDLPVGDAVWFGFAVDPNGDYHYAMSGGITGGGTADLYFDRWTRSHNLSIGATAAGERQWVGQVHHVDFFCRALSEQELISVGEATAPQRP